MTGSLQFHAISVAQLSLPSAGELFIPVYKTGYSSSESASNNHYKVFISLNWDKILYFRLKIYPLIGVYKVYIYDIIKSNCQAKLWLISDENLLWKKLVCWFLLQPLDRHINQTKKRALSMTREKSWEETIFNSGTPCEDFVWHKEKIILIL